MSPTPDQHIRQALKALQGETKALEKQIKGLEKELAAKRKQQTVLAGMLGQAAPKASKPAAKPVRKKKRKKGGMTIEAAVLKAVADAKDPLSTGQITAVMKAMGVTGAQITIYGTISRLKKAGQIKAVKHSGRGDAYVAGGSAKKAAVAKKKKKPAAKKKAAPKKKPVAKKKASSPKKKAVAPKKKVAAKK